MVMTGGELNKMPVCVGMVSCAHGVRGAVKIKSFTKNPKDFLSYGDLRDEKGTKTFRMKILSETKGAFIASVEGVNDRNEAENLRGTKLFVLREAFLETKPDEYYHVDLIGMDAVTTTGKIIGKVVSICNFGAGDILEIEMQDGQTEMLSFSKTNVPDVNVENRRMTVVFPKSVTVKRQESAGGAS